MSKNKNNNKRLSTIGTGNNNNGYSGFENILELGTSKIPQEILNSIWRGDELSKENIKIANHVTSSITSQQLEAILIHLRSISSNIPELDISTIHHTQPPKQLKLSKKKQPVNKNKNKKKTTNKKKSKDESEDEEMDEEEAPEEEEEQEQQIDVQQEQEEEQPQISNQFIEFLEFNEISVQNLSAILYWLISSIAIKDQEIKFNAGSIYTRMIILSRKSFHPFIFRSVMKLFAVKKPTIKLPTEKKVAINSKKSNKKQSGNDESATVEGEDEEESSDDEESEDEEDDANNNKRETRESREKNKNIWLKKVLILLEDLNWLFFRFSLTTFSEPLTNAIESISNLTHSFNFKKEKEPKVAGKRQTNAQKLEPLEERIIQTSFTVLSNLIEENRHGQLQIVLPILLKEFISILTLNSTGSGISSSSTTTVPKFLITDRNNVLDFICNKLLACNPNTHDQIHILIQHICMKVLERTDFRNHTAESIAKIFVNLSSHQRFITHFFLTYSKNSKSHFRSFSIEVALLLLDKFGEESEDIKDKFTKEEIQLLVEQLLGILVDRSSDKVSVVRSKALTSLSNLLENNKSFDLIKDHLKNVFNLDHYESKDGDNKEKVAIDSDDEEDKENNGATRKNKPSLLSFLSKRSEDEKSAVRKSALQVLEVISLQNGGVTKPILNILLKKCQDSSPLVRKQVITTLSLLLKSYPDDFHIIDTWRKAVIPLITDREQTIMDKSLDSINEVLFGSILNPQDNKFIWKLLNDISIEMKPYLHKICGLMSSRKMITPQLIKCIQSIIRASKDENIAGGWTLFSEISYCCPDKLDQNLIIGAWNMLKVQVDDKSITNQQKEEKIQLLCSVLTVIETLCSILPIDIAKSLFNEIYTKVKQFSYDPTVTQLFIIILVKLTTRIFKSDGGNISKVNNAIADWSKNILTICDEQLSIYALPNVLQTRNKDIGNTSQDKEDAPQNSQSEEKLSLYLFTIGEIIQIPQAKIPGRLKTVVQALIAPTLSTIYNKNTSSNGDDEDDLMITQDDKPIPISIRAHAFITLGKLCLGDDRLAKKCIATFAKELEISDSPIIRNNVMVVMCDLCVRYTQLVDNYIPNIAMCLRDSSELVRRQTLVLLTRLLQEDYVKWRGSLFFRFVEALVDPSPIVKQFANYCLMNVLQIKYGMTIQTAPGNKTNAADAAAGNKEHQGNVFYGHFLETIFVLNNCKAHSVYNQSSVNPTFSLSMNRNATVGGANSNQFSHHGQDNFDKRMSIYTLFLNNMKDYHRFSIMHKIVKEVLLEVTEERYGIQDCYGVIYDSLSILSCKEIKLQSLSTLKSTLENADSEMSEQQKQQVEASSKLLTDFKIKAVVESIVPILVELKSLFEKKRSNLLRLVISFLAVLKKDYKKELTDFFSENSQLEKEIEYDIKNMNKKQVQSPLKPTGIPVSNRRASLGSNIVNSPIVSVVNNNNNNNVVVATPLKPDMTNFLVPQIRTPKPPGSVRRLSIATTTPTLKPFNQPLGRLSITPLKPSTPVLQQQQNSQSKIPLTPFNQLIMNELPESAKKGNNNLFGSNLNNNNNNNTGGSVNSIVNSTPLRSAMRHSIGGIPSSAIKSAASMVSPSPFKKSIRFNSDNSYDDDDDEKQQFPPPPPILPPKTTTIPSSLPIRISIQAKNSLNADIVLPNPDNPPTPTKWNIGNNKDDDDNINENDQTTIDDDQEQEESIKLTKRSRKPSKIEIFDEEEEQEEQEEFIKPKRGSKPAPSTSKTVNKKSSKIVEENQEEEVIKPKRGRKPKIIEQDDESDYRDEDYEDDEEERIVQVKKRGRSSSSKTAPTTTTKVTKKKK